MPEYLKHRPWAVVAASLVVTVAGLGLLLMTGQLPTSQLQGTAVTPAPLIHPRPTNDPPPRVSPTPPLTDLIPSSTPDDRFGVVISASLRDAEITTTLDQLGAGPWYTFDASVGRARGQVGLLRPGADHQRVTALVRSAPGGAWLIGNEPNVPGQDDQDPGEYADFLASVVETVRGADPTAQLIGPNVLNWDATCTLCPGYASGRTWSEAFLSIYLARYGELPFDAWGMHTYSLDWQRLPLADANADRQQILGARAWLTAQGLDLPIWLTEFGAIWGYEGLEWVDRPETAGQIEPRGTYRLDLLEAYLDQMLGWLKQEGPGLGVQRWFVYALTPVAEPYASAPTGIALVDPADSALTPLGERYRRWSFGRLPTRVQQPS